MRIDFIRGDITEQAVDEVVNAADIPCWVAAIGESVATTGGDLPARWVIHTVGPTWDKTKDKSPLLRSCYATSLAVADGLS